MPAINKVMELQISEIHMVTNSLLLFLKNSIEK